jgi:ribokinase
LKKGNVLIFGGIIVDSYMAVENYPIRGQDVFMHDSFDRVGGCAINVAQTLKNMGMDPYVVSAIGGDTRGNMIMKYLKDEKFHTDCIKQLEEEDTGYCATILEDGGERTFLTYKGCESFFSTKMIPDDLMKNASYAYITGYYLLDERYSEDILKNIDKLKAEGSRVLFDPGPLAHHIKKETLLSVISKADIITPNESEADNIKNLLSLNIEPEDWSGEMNIELVVLKSGSRGVKVWNHDMGFYMPPYKVEAIDTTGAGDSFAAGLIYGLWKGLTTYEAVRFASACGAIATTFKGPHGKFGVEDVMKLIRTNREEIYDR